jgi:hypothetical protein
MKHIVTDNTIWRAALFKQLCWLIVLDKHFLGEPGAKAFKKHQTEGKFNKRLEDNVIMARTGNLCVKSSHSTDLVFAGRTDRPITTRDR